VVELTRKQREIEQRTAEILSVARPILLQEGFQALSMDRVAARMEYAKGTIYNHFANKEEIVLALATQGMQLRQNLFARAIAYDGPSRNRLTAVGAACEFFVTHCVDDFRIEQLLRHENIWDKSSVQRQATICDCETRCIDYVCQVVQDAIQAGDLTLPDSLNPQEIVFGFWAISYGSQALTHSSPSLQAIGIRNPGHVMRVLLNSLANGFNWQPLRDWQEHAKLTSLIHSQLQADFQGILESRKVGLQ
jgi:AcrR family transcriptional regulator